MSPGSQKDARLLLRAYRTSVHHLLWLLRSPTLEPAERAVFEAQLLELRRSIKQVRAALASQPRPTSAPSCAA